MMYLIVGAGLSGAVIAERIANVLKKEVLVIDQRDHIAGNIYDYIDDNGVMVHKYGPHAFHTNNSEVWTYLSKFTSWHFYHHRVAGVIDGKSVPLPFNFDSLYKLFPAGMAQKYENKLLELFGYGKKVPILELIKNGDTDLKHLAEYIYQNVFAGYTAKQWGLTPEELDGSVTARVPIYLTRDDRYFQDKYQGIPSEGYTAMVAKMLLNDKITVELNRKFDKSEINNYEKVIFTGMIDEYFDFQYGSLPYRSLEFDLRTVEKEYYQELAQVNYPNNYDFTRITEFKYFLDQKTDKTTIAIEYPLPYEQDKNDAYYPVPANENRLLYNKYKELALQEKNTLFVGRLANYTYLNMDQIVELALSTFERSLK